MGLSLKKIITVFRGVEQRVEKEALIPSLAIYRERSGKDNSCNLDVLTPG